MFVMPADEEEVATTCPLRQECRKVLPTLLRTKRKTSIKQVILPIENGSTNQTRRAEDASGKIMLSPLSWKDHLPGRRQVPRCPSSRWPDFDHEYRFAERELEGEAISGESNPATPGSF